MIFANEDRLEQWSKRKQAKGERIIAIKEHIGGNINP